MSESNNNWELLEDVVDVYSNKWIRFHGNEEFRYSPSNLLFNYSAPCGYATELIRNLNIFPNIDGFIFASNKILEVNPNIYKFFDDFKKCNVSIVDYSEIMMFLENQANLKSKINLDTKFLDYHNTNYNDDKYLDIMFNKVFNSPIYDPNNVFKNFLLSNNDINVSIPNLEIYNRDDVLNHIYNYVGVDTDKDLFKVPEYLYSKVKISLDSIEEFVNNSLIDFDTIVTKARRFSMVDDLSSFSNDNISSTSTITVDSFVYDDVGIYVNGVQYFLFGLMVTVFMIFIHMHLWHHRYSKIGAKR